MRVKTNPDPRKAETDVPALRSGAVARLVGMPVTTLRVWERRYGLGAADASPAGHRLYSLADVQRIAALKRLTRHGHAIGAIALLDAAALQALQAAGDPPSAVPAPRGTRRVIVVGAALGPRLQRALRPERRIVVTAVFDGLAQAAAAATPRRADALVIAAPSLRPESVREVQAAARAWRVDRVGVLYGFGGAPAKAALAAAGIALLRESHDDAALAAWVDGWWTTPTSQPKAVRAAAARPGAIAPRRWDDATLAALAARASSVDCECPRHVAELLMQLAHFEAYCGDCVHRSPRDAALHAQLQQLTGAARMLFEQALERVVAHEGVSLG